MAERYEWWSSTRWPSLLLCASKTDLTLQARQTPSTPSPHLLSCKMGSQWGFDSPWPVKLDHPWEEHMQVALGQAIPIRHTSRHPGLIFLVMVEFRKVLKICFCLKCTWHWARKHTVNLKSDRAPTLIRHFLRPQVVQSKKQPNKGQKHRLRSLAAWICALLCPLFSRVILVKLFNLSVYFSVKGKC